MSISPKRLTIIVRIETAETYNKNAPVEPRSSTPQKASNARSIFNPIVIYLFP